MVHVVEINPRVRMWTQVQVLQMSVSKVCLQIVFFSNHYRKSKIFLYLKMFCNCILILKLILFHNSFYKPIQNKNKENHYWSRFLYLVFIFEKNATKATNRPYWKYKKWLFRSGSKKETFKFHLSFFCLFTAFNFLTSVCCTYHASW